MRCRLIERSQLRERGQLAEESRKAEARLAAIGGGEACPQGTEQPPNSLARVGPEGGAAGFFKKPLPRSATVLWTSVDGPIGGPSNGPLFPMTIDCQAAAGCVVALQYTGLSTSSVQESKKRSRSVLHRQEAPQASSSFGLPVCNLCLGSGGQQRQERLLVAGDAV